MADRPTAVKVIGWFLRIGGVLGMVLALPYALWGQELFAEYWAGFFLRLSPLVLFFWVFLSSLLCLLCGNGILKGRNWARNAALTYGVVGTLLAAMLYRGSPLYWPNLLGDVAFIVSMWFFLYRSQANAFFRS